MLKTAIVTGATGGIGYATTVRLLRDGCQVLAVGSRSAEAAAEKFAPLGERVTYLSADLGTEAGCARVIAAAQALERIDILVNVAGVAPKVRADILEMTPESYDRVMDINTKATFFITQAVANKMRLQAPGADGQRGYIVNVSSLSAYTSSTSRGEYCISKAGVSMITKLFADRLAAEGIPVNEVRPGIIATDMTATVTEKYDRLIAGGLLPNPRWGQPEDVADAIAVLCDGSLRYTTGQSIDVDGGFHIRRL